TEGGGNLLGLAAFTARENTLPESAFILRPTNKTRVNRDCDREILFPARIWASRMHFGKQAYSNQALGVLRARASLRRELQVRSNRGAWRRGMSFMRGTSA